MHRIRLGVIFLFFVSAEVSTNSGILFAQSPEPKQVQISDKVTLHYVEKGKGEPLIFVHGLTGDYSVWLKQVDAFSEKGYRTIAYSRRYNFPNKNERVPNHSASVEADDLSALIQKLGLGKAHIVGHSYGAYTALMLALNHSESVRTLTLCEPPLVTWLSSLTGKEGVAAREQSKKLLSRGVIPARSAIRTGKDELALRLMIDVISGEGKYDKLPAPVRKRMLRNINELKAIMTSQRAYPPIKKENVQRMTIPTLMISGSETVATAKFTDPELERLLPDKTSKRVSIPGATHIMWIEKPGQSRDAVLKFIQDK